MANSHRGKFFLLFLLLIFIFDFRHDMRVSANSNSVLDGNNKVGEKQIRSIDAISVLNEQKILLEQLQELVRNLSELVSRLESRVSDSPKEHNVKQSSVSVLQENIKIDIEKTDDSLVDKVREGERVGGAVSVTKYSPFWSERFQFVSAVKLESDATCINVLPFRDFEGLSKYVAVGDDRGRVFLFLRNGDVLVEFCTLSDSPITAMVSYISVYKNESVVVTGHENGIILVHRAWEVLNGEELSSFRMETMGKFTSSEIEGGGSMISVLEVHNVGRTRYILSADASGKIRVFRENGTMYGLVIPSSRPLAFLKQRLLFLTETGVGSLDLRTMKIRESECEGLNNSVAKSYVFDATERSKAYGVTSDGDLMHVLLLGDIMNFKCRVRSKRKFEMAGPLAFQAIKGYLLVANQEKIFVFNVSTQHYIRAGGPRLLLTADLDEIIASFLNYQAMDMDAQRKRVIPLIASDGEKLIILSFGNGYVGMYHSNLPLLKNEFSSMLWTSPVLFFILFLFGAWHFFANKKEALTSWAPDDPFTSTSVKSGAPLVSGSGDKSSADSSSRNPDVMDLRGGLRGPPRRYVSPPRYTAGSVSSYGPSSADTGSRPATGDPSYRTGSELKFRGSNLGTTDFSNRRENLFANSQVVNDSN